MNDWQFQAALHCRQSGAEVPAQVRERQTCCKNVSHICGGADPVWVTLSQTGGWFWLFVALFGHLPNKWAQLRQARKVLKKSYFILCVEIDNLAIFKVLFSIKWFLFSTFWEKSAIRSNDSITTSNSLALVPIKLSQCDISDIVGKIISFVLSSPIAKSWLN